MARTSNRPLSPHLTIWRWGPHMLVSILHRATGSALAIAGGVLFTWWLAALASGEEGYGRFIDLMTADAGGLNPVPLVIAIGLSWAFFQHLLSGMRHLLLDTGAGYELKRNKTGAMLTLVGSTLLTLGVWAWVLTR